MPRKCCLGDAARVAFGAQAAFLDALQVLQLRRCWGMRATATAAARRGASSSCCRSGGGRSGGSTLVVGLVVMMVVVVVQRSARAVVADLLGQGLAAPS